MNVRDIKPRSQQNPNLNWREMNALLESLSGLDKDYVRNKLGDRDGYAKVNTENEPHYIRSLPHTNIPAHAVIDIEEGNPVLEQLFTTCRTKANSDQNELFTTYGDYPATNTTSHKYISLIGTHRPRSVAYSGTAPTSGDIVGPVPGAYTVSTKYEGLQVVGDIDAVNHRCWVIRHFAGNKIIRFKLKAILPLGGKSTAIEIKTGTGYEEVGDVFPIKDPWNDPGSWREDLVTHSATEGYRGFCVVPANAETDEVTGKVFREIIWMEQIAESIDFTLTTNLTAGTANSTIDKYYMGKDPEKVFPVGAVPVYDPQGLYPHAIIGCKGKARYNNRENKYEIVTCDQMVLMMRCRSGSAMCVGEQAQLASQTAITWSPYGKMPPTPPTLADNPLNLECMPNDMLTVIYNHTAAAWQVENVGHHEVQLAEDIEIGSCGLSVITRPYSVQKCRNDAGGSSHPLVVHTYLNSLFVDGCTIKGRVGTVCGFGVVSLHDVDVLTLTEKDVIVSMGRVDTTGDTSGADPSECIIQATKNRICVLEPAVPTVTIVEVLRGKPVLMVQDVIWENKCLKQYKTVAYVLCSEASGPAEVITCAEPCPTSGSGGG